MRRFLQIQFVKPLRLSLLIALATIPACSKGADGTNCNLTPTASGCVPPPNASASLTIFRGPQVVGDTTMGLAFANTTRGDVLAQATYNGTDIGVRGNPAVFEHAPAAGTAVYGARPIQTGATLRNALEESFAVALINATSTIDKTSINLGEAVQVTVPAQPGRDSVVVFENGARRGRVLEGGAVVSITPSVAGTSTITTTGYNGPITQTGSSHVVTVH